MMEKVVKRAAQSQGPPTLPERVMPADHEKALPKGAARPEAQIVQRSFAPPTAAALRRPRVAAAKKRLTGLSLGGAVFLGAACVTFMLFYFRDGGSMRSTGMFQSQVDSSPATGFEMRAEPQGDTLVLSWKRDNPVLQSATDGVLKIDDGPLHREIPLDRGKIDAGLIPYKPASSLVVFRLELHEKEGTRVAESLEFINAPTSAATSASTPQPNVAEPHKPSSAETVAHQKRPKEIAVAKTRSQTRPRRPSPKLSQTARPARRAPDHTIGAIQSAPSVPVESTRPAPSSLVAQQMLPKPPPGPAAVAQAAQASGYVPARPLKWAAPDMKSLGVPAISAPADIAIKLRIDESGRVVAAHALLDRSTPNETLTAAVTARVRQWIFEPAKMHGKNVPSEDTVVIHLDPKR
jgi:hypothetical protein